MEAKLDPAQFGNQKRIAIQNYLIQMWQRILCILDSNSKVDVFVAMYVLGLLKYLSKSNKSADCVDV